MLESIIQPVSLISVRLSPFFLGLGLAPMAKFPGMIRLYSLLILSICLSSIYWGDWRVLTEGQWIVGVFSEFFLGIIMLLGFQLAYAGILIIGQVLDMQIGFAAAGIIDPVSRNTNPLLGQIFSIFFTLLIFITNMHLTFLEYFGVLLEAYPPGQWDLNFGVLKIVEYFTAQLLASFLLFAPIIMGLWLLDLFSGIVAKTMPQMNVYFVMLPLKIGVGIALISVNLPNMSIVLSRMLMGIHGWFDGQWIA